VAAECLNCVRLSRALEAATRDVGNLEVELRVKRATITKLHKELEGQADDEVSAKDARAVFVYWRCRLHPMAKTFAGKRRRAVLDRLADKPEPYTVLDLMDAIDGACVDAKYPAMKELEYICRDGTIVDRYRSAAAAHAAWQDRALQGLAGPFEVTEELVSEGIEILSAQRAPVEIDRAVRAAA
jgi:hypothetical protein